MESLQNKLKAIPENTECFILIHGLARTSRCMNKAATIIKKYGYDVISIDYPSRKKSIGQLVKEDIRPLIKSCESYNYKEIHFLTHSMGGILLRYYLSLHSIKNLGKTVMLAPPNQGSEIVDKLGHWAIFSYLNGPAGLELGTDNKSIPKQLSELDFEAGIITGNKSINPLLSALITGNNDGKVSVNNTKVKGMKDFLVVPYPHPIIMQQTSIIHQTLFFTQNSFFYR